MLTFGVMYYSGPVTGKRPISRNRKPVGGVKGPSFSVRFFVKLSFLHQDLAPSLGVVNGGSLDFMSYPLV